jgi:glycosidase
MWGADDPDPRKPMIWADLDYEDEATHPFGRPRRRDQVTPDMELFGTYQDLIELRREHLRLFVDGVLNVLLTDDARGLLAYERVLGEERAIVVFNTSREPQVVSVSAPDGAYRVEFPEDQLLQATGGSLSVELPPFAAQVWVRD